MIKSFAAGGVVIRKEGDRAEVLLIKDKYGNWTWPKGHLEEGETPQQAAIREITEETGLSKIILDELAGVQEYVYRLDETEIFKTVYIYLVRSLPGEKIRIQVEEIDGAEWFSVQDAVDKIEYSGSKDILIKAVNLFEKKDLQ